MHALFVEDGEMEKRVFLATWKDIPAQNEVQHEICNVQHNAGTDSLLFAITKTLHIEVYAVHTCKFSHNCLTHFFP